MRRGRPWTFDEEREIDRLTREGKTDVEMAEALGRSRAAVTKKRISWGLWRRPWGNYVPPLKA